MRSGSLPTHLHVLIPFWGLAGGVIKILDYAAHGRDLGIGVTLWAPKIPDSTAPIHQLPAARRLLDDSEILVRSLSNLNLRTVSDDHVVLFTEPTHHRLIEDAIDQPLGARLCHLIQGTRHGNPEWQNGENYRLLHRPMSRIAVTPQVVDAISPHVNSRYGLATILEGHAVEYFSGRPHPSLTVGAAAEHPPQRLRVLYTTWKSDLGDRVAAALAGDDVFAWIPVRTEMTWPALRNRYHGSDVLLCTPGPEEGFYLPGLEAMAARVAVISSIVGGNASYLVPDVNALVASYDDVDEHVAALKRLASDPFLRNNLVQAGNETIQRHTLRRERDEFMAVLGSLVGN